jgi:hypothetical protein
MLPSYLSQCQHNANMYEVDCDLFSAHLKENGFQLMLTHTVAGCNVMYEVFWNKEKYMLCSLQRCLANGDFNTCIMIFEVATDDYTTIPKLAHELGSSTSANFSSSRQFATYSFHLQWNLDVKSTVDDTFPKLYNHITTFKSVEIGHWRGRHAVANLFGTNDYKDICAQCPVDFRVLLSGIDSQGSSK